MSSSFCGILPNLGLLAWVPGVIGRIPTAAGTTFVPRRAGRLRVWAVIGGAKTNVLTLRVLPRRCRY